MCFMSNSESSQHSITMSFAQWEYPTLYHKLSFLKGGNIMQEIKIQY